ncbi:hypothetical protein [Acidipila sp. EB88]|uniref:hypothetical protein n=1 Tax=Acidipila sp. EB88 TaxID=2305226 RepID=UPI000F5EC821|nr:hypothetical protein [Acidipila sp. EB88]RRA47890.1 hypothetical protein D1Y84_05860 [Acidipila sp. EB88]
MIADWSVECAPDSPWIVVPWEAWVDLRADAGAAAQLPEVEAYPELLALLHQVNQRALFSAKVDVFAVDANWMDPELAEEFPADSLVGLGSYLDVLPRAAAAWTAFPACEQMARAVVAQLHQSALIGASFEVVVRPASAFGLDAFGWTLYATGAGADPAAARATWAAAAALLVQAFCDCFAAAVATMQA